MLPVEPDILFISNQHTGMITARNVQGAPNLIIEILSPSNPEHDRRRKYDLYEQHGMAEYWIVDPEAWSIEVYGLAEGAYALLGHFGAEETARSNLLEGFTVTVGEVIPEG